MHGDATTSNCCGLTDGGQRPAQRRIEPLGVAGADGVGDFVEHQRGVVGAQRQHVLARQNLALGGKEHQLFELAPRHFAVIAQRVAQRGGDIGVGADAGLPKRSR